MIRNIGLSVVILITLAAIASSAQIDVSGTWTAVVELDVGSGEPTFVFTQDGETVTGTYEGTFGSAELTGKVMGDTIEFSFGAEGVGEAKYTGTIEGNSMEGTGDYGIAGGGTWSATRAE